MPLVDLDPADILAVSIPAPPRSAQTTDICDHGGLDALPRHGAELSRAVANSGAQRPESANQYQLDEERRIDSRCAVPTLTLTPIFSCPPPPFSSRADIDDTTLAEADDRASRRNLDALDDFTFAIDHVVDRAGVHRARANGRRANPQVAIQIAARRAAVNGGR